MDAISAKSMLYAYNFKPVSSSSTSACISPSFLQCRGSGLTYQSAQSLGFRKLKSHCIRIKQRNVGFVRASSDTVGVSQGWLLEPSSLRNIAFMACPAGDGNYKHIGYKVDMPGAYEIFSNEMIVGRVPDKADLVIPVATVSGLHARIRTKEGNLLVTDLDSTNGTFINEKRVPPGATALVPPGSLLTFGDTHLAIFRVSRVEKTIEATATGSEMQPESNVASAAPQPETT